MLRSALCLLFGLLLTGCSRTYYIGIETFNPSEITFPPTIGKIAVVNNAAAQPLDTGHDLEVYGVKQDTVRAQADTAIFYLCKSVAESIAQKKYFNDVLLYGQTIRDDNQFLVDKKLSTENVRMLCDSAETDGLISFDRVLFKTDKSISVLPWGMIRGEIKVTAIGIARAYLNDKDTPLATFAFTDSVMWVEESESVEWLNLILPSTEEAMNQTSYFISDRIANKFTPYWDQAERWYYAGFSSTWKQATAYATAQRWKEAATIWEQLYNSAKKGSTKAKLALNMALSYELRGDFDQALSWATESSRLFNEHADVKDENRELLVSYVETLKGRILSNKKLDTQIGQ